jgi:PAS domain S-box-containing protein
MKRLRHTTFWRYNFFLEISALLLISVILFLGIWLTMGEMGRKYLELRLADADKVDLFIGDQLDNARGAFQLFSELREADRSPEVLRLVGSFSDLYRLDGELRVAHIYKTKAGSRVFPGFSLSGGKLGGYLKTPDAYARFSEIMRGYEDDAPSVYLAMRTAGDLYLGRLNLGYVQNFLSEFSHFTGTPLMLVASDGFVMLSGTADVRIPFFDLKQWSGAPSARRTLCASECRWIPLVSQRITLGARTVILIPTDLLDTQRTTLLLFMLGFLGGLIVLVYLKNRRLNRLILHPIAAFAEQMRDLEKGKPLSAAADSGQRFAEFDSIHTRFRTMAEAIAQRERSLRESERKYRLLTERMKDVVWTLDPDTLRFTYVSPSVEQLRGLTPEEILAEPVDAALMPAAASAIRSLLHQRTQALLSGQASPEHFYIDEVEQPRQDGSTVWTEVLTTYCLDEETGRVEIQGVTRDVSERKEAQQALIAAKQQAEAANRAKSTFLANMSHEIRTPLNAILGFAQVLIRAPNLSAEHRNYLATIQRSGQHLLALLNDILDMAKVEAGRMTCEHAPFDLAGLIQETEAVFRRRAHDRGVALRVETGGLPQRVNGDALKLRQVLINLVSNAVKFTRAGSVTLQVKAIGDDAIRFSVIDTGMGIAAEELGDIFAPFTQSESGRHTQGGTGLGLTLCKDFVQLMGGDLRVESAPGRGSRFSFTLTLPPVETFEPAAITPQGNVLGLEPGQSICRVLLVDDQADNRAPLRALLNSLNPQPPVLEIREATNGQEAVERWETWQPHLIFMDMRMPVMSGEMATRDIKARMDARPETERTLVVALTASAFDEQQNQCQTSGCDAFIHKPFQIEALLDVLERLGGLRFIRDEDPLPAWASLSPAAAAQHLVMCPADWRADLERAVDLADFSHINDLLEPVHDWDPVLAGTLAQWVDNFDLDAFTALIGGNDDTCGRAS